MPGKMNYLNHCEPVVTKPTGRVGGTNTPVTLTKNATRYTGGLNKDACDVPKKK